ncbi:hypothetical protein H310_12039 [Aphanomyces invadans]|uniref:Uncharacterized protein n=1 Tax=Aphanomyces invadans TaxID=157072 RepID=A0A024TJW2_9STRA|nr:hypothetical protein H310_12039 [Aphanomyces invadans]ETV94410.1 hypothetical protein H310_12039 [Aphanomyces invadans]|eukprot:XP_008877172.1 hypothetical protein H310_12039 [Aphanomyces invadans]
MECFVAVLGKASTTISAVGTKDMDKAPLRTSSRRHGRGDCGHVVAAQCDGVLAGAKVGHETAEPGGFACGFSCGDVLRLAAGQSRDPLSDAFPDQHAAKEQPTEAGGRSAVGSSGPACIAEPVSEDAFGADRVRRSWCV